MNQPSSSSGHISASIALLLIAITIAIGAMAVGVYLDAHGETLVWQVEPTATAPRSYPCSPLADGSYLPARVQIEYEAQCKQLPK